MRLPIPLALFLLLLAACAGDDRGQAVERPVTAGFVADAEDVVEVTVRHAKPVQEADLVGPDGRVYMAQQIERDRLVEERGGIAPSLGVGVFGGSSGRVGTSVGIGIPLGGFGGGPDEPEVVSRARIRIEDMAAYRANWQDWIVRIRLGTPDTGVQFMEVPAPPPPPLD